MIANRSNLSVTYRREMELLTCRTQTSEINYRIYQIYGQQHVKNLDPGVYPEPTTEVFVANLPRNMSIVDLFKYLAQCGEIYQLRLLMDFSGTNRGKCFVQYRRVKASRNAICCLHQEFIDRTHQLLVKMSLDNSTLLLKSIPSWVPELQVQGVVQSIMGAGLVNMAVRKSKNGTQYCLCVYRNHQAAVMAHKKTWPVLHVFGTVLDVHWAIPELLKSSFRLYFTNFHQDLTKRELFEAVSQKIDLYGLIQFRILNTCGNMLFRNEMAMHKALRDLQNLTIKGVPMIFSETPFNVTFRRTTQRIQRPRFPTHRNFNFDATTATHNLQMPAITRPLGGVRMPNFPPGIRPPVLRFLPQVPVMPQPRPLMMFTPQIYSMRMEFLMVRRELASRMI